MHFMTHRQTHTNLILAAEAKNWKMAQYWRDELDSIDEQVIDKIMDKLINELNEGREA